MDSNISTIAIMREKFGCEVGLSDHTLGIGAAITSIAFGSSIIEKHFTLDRQEGGIDSAFSLNPLEMRSLVTESQTAHQSLGRVFFGVTRSEKDSVKYRRSIYFSKNLEKNEIINENNIKIIRPGFGLKPIFYKKILGKRLRTKVKFADPVLKKNIIF
jgi:sialic acid synthase SpsE